MLSAKTLAPIIVAHSSAWPDDIRSNMGIVLQHWWPVVILDTTLSVLWIFFFFWHQYKFFLHFSPLYSKSFDLLTIKLRFSEGKLSTCWRQSRWLLWTVSLWRILYSDGELAERIDRKETDSVKSSCPIPSWTVMTIHNSPIVAVSWWCFASWRPAVDYSHRTVYDQDETHLHPFRHRLIAHWDSSLLLAQ